MSLALLGRWFLAPFGERMKVESRSPFSTHCMSTNSQRVSCSVLGDEGKE